MPSLFSAKSCQQVRTAYETFSRRFRLHANSFLFISFLPSLRFILSSQKTMQWHFFLLPRCSHFSESKPRSSSQMAQPHRRANCVFPSPQHGAIFALSVRTSSWKPRLAKWFFSSNLVSTDNLAFYLLKSLKGCSRSFPLKSKDESSPGADICVATGRGSCPYQFLILKNNVFK
jgi:hypothetical protein